MGGEGVRIRREWAMPNAATFTILPIAELLKRYVKRPEAWADPFSGWNSPAGMTNDLNPKAPTKHHLDARHFLSGIRDGSLEGVIFDPPYSPRQVKEVYDSIGIKLAQEDTQATFWSSVKDAAARKVCIGGTAVCCGWNSAGFGRSRGFEFVEILLVPHGGMHNDSIVTAEVRVQESLSSFGEM